MSVDHGGGLGVAGSRCRCTGSAQSLQHCPAGHKLCKRSEELCNELADVHTCTNMLLPPINSSGHHQRAANLSQSGFGKSGYPMLGYGIAPPSRPLHPRRTPQAGLKLRSFTAALACRIER